MLAERLTADFGKGFAATNLKYMRQFYERAALSTRKEQMLTRARSRAEKYAAQDFVKDPYVLEFLGLKESPALSESQLEAALLDHLQGFLLELGKGFSFVARQQRMTIEGDHCYVDLIFYNRLLRAFVLIDLKTGKLTHRDIGQMQTYVNYYRREVREEWEAPAIGILTVRRKEGCGRALHLARRRATDIRLTLSALLAERR